MWYGVDQNGPMPYTPEDDCVEVPETLCPLDELGMSELRTHTHTCTHTHTHTMHTRTHTRTHTHTVIRHSLGYMRCMVECIMYKNFCPPFIIRLPYDHTHAVADNLSKNFGCWVITYTHTHTAEYILWLNWYLFQDQLDIMICDKR